MWFNVTGETTSREQNLDALTKGRDSQRRRLYNDRQIDTFDDGFLARYTCNVVLHDGSTVALWACLVADGARWQDRQALRVPRLEQVQAAPTPAHRGAELVTEYETRELCERFFDAYQEGRLDVLREVMAEDCIVWHNVFGRETTREENLAAYPDSYTGQRRRTYNDRDRSTPSRTAS